MQNISITQIYDPENKRYEPPYPEVPVLNKSDKMTDTNQPLISDYNVELDEVKFGFAVLRKSDNLVMYVNYNLYIP